MFLLGFRGKWTALALCKPIESAIQWLQIHYRITFATIQNSAVYHSGARVSIFATLVLRLKTIHKRSTALEASVKILLLQGLNRFHGANLTLDSDVDQDT